MKISAVLIVKLLKIYPSFQKINQEKMVITLNAILVNIKDINYIIKYFAIHVT
jgi:hypothetical protein